MTIRTLGLAAAVTGAISTGALAQETGDEFASLQKWMKNSVCANIPAGEIQNYNCRYAVLDKIFRESNGTNILFNGKGDEEITLKSTIEHSSLGYAKLLIGIYLGIYDDVGGDSFTFSDESLKTIKAFQDLYYSTANKDVLPPLHAVYDETDVIDPAKLIAWIEEYFQILEMYKQGKYSDIVAMDNLNFPPLVRYYGGTAEENAKFKEIIRRNEGALKDGVITKGEAMEIK